MTASTHDRDVSPKTKTSTGNITNSDGTRTIITTTEVTTINAVTKEEVTIKEVDKKHLPSIPNVRRDNVTLPDGTTGWKKSSTIVHPGGQREITIENPDGKKEIIHKGLPETCEGENSTEEYSRACAAAPTWSSSPWVSVLTKLRHHADAMTQKTAISFLQTNGNKTPTVSSSMTYQNLFHSVEYLAYRFLPPRLEKNGLIPIPSDQPLLTKGERILLVYPPCSPHFILTFLACIRCGLVAVPVYPPHPDRKDSISAFVGIARGCGARVALTNGEYAQAKRLGNIKNSFLSKLNATQSSREGGEENDARTWPEDLIWVVTDGEPVKHPPALNTFPKIESIPEPHEIAFIQYTSGSTSAPKGVTLTHANLAHNLYIITNELKASSETTVVSWLPQYHDMGLIGSLIGTIYCGGTGYYMSPIAFLQRPMGWLEAVSEHRGTHLQAPNFAFGLTARKFNPAEYIHGLRDTKGVGQNKRISLDLSCVKHVVNGAEPVTEKSMEAFYSAFSRFGFPSGVIFPTYGLAEHTVFVCSGGKGKLTVRKKDLEEENKVVAVVEETNHHTVQFLGCGFPSRQNVDVQIVDPVKQISLPDGTVGEIWINSPSKAIGYFGKKSEDTNSEFHAFLNDKKEKSIECGGYLRSGDLGFFHEEQLYICGRIKDLIITSGRNHYPQDIEATAEDIASEYVRPGCSAAFSTGVKPDAQEEYEDIVLAMELKEILPSTSKYEMISDLVRADIFKEHSLSLACVVLVKQKTIPKTTSGKIQRSKAKQAFIEKRLQEVYRKDFSARGASSDRHVDSNEGRTGEGKMPKPIPGKGLTSAEVRALDRTAIRNMLLESISQLANIEKSSIPDGSPLTSYMDSVTLAQLKGLLESRYAVSTMSDAYLFNDATTLKKLVEVVKVGVAKDDTREGSIGGGSRASEGGGGCCGCRVM